MAHLEWRGRGVKGRGARWEEWRGLPSGEEERRGGGMARSGGVEDEPYHIPCCTRNQTQSN